MSLRIAGPGAITSLAGVAVHQSWRYWLAQVVVKEAVTFLGHQLVASEEHFDTFRQGLRNVFSPTFCLYPSATLSDSSVNWSDPGIEA